MTASSYTPELAAEICERLSEGESLRSICSDVHMPDEKAVRDWARFDHNGFAEPYARARDGYLDRMADEVIRIADTPQEGVKTKTTDEGVEVTEGDMIEHRRLRVDTRKWYLAKLAPKRYGDRIAHEHSGPDGGPIATVVTDESRAALAAALFARAGATLLGQHLDRQPYLVAGPKEPPAA